MRLMPSRFLALAAIVTLALVTDAQAAETWAQRLGYPTDRPVLIFNAEGMGMCYEMNEAGRQLVGEGLVQSVAIMPPCPWFNDFADWARKQEDLDAGLLITLNSPYANYRWPVLSDRSHAPGLAAADGNAWKSILQVAINATPEEVEREIQAQIDRAREAGLRPTHLKTYLGTLVARPDFFGAYLKIARENWIPAGIIELSPELVERFRRDGFPLEDEVIDLVNNYPLPKLDDLRFPPVASSYEEMREGLIQAIRDLGPGITEFLFFPAVESESLKRMTPDWQQHVWEAQLLKDPEVASVIEDVGAVFTSWTEMMSRFEGENRAITEESDVP